MAENVALTSDELTALLNKEQVCDLRLTYVPDTVVGTATVGGLVTSPSGEISVSSPSAGWASAKAEQTVKITNGSTVRGYYRVRSAPSSSVLYVNEMAHADQGLFTNQTGTLIQSGDTATILERYDLWPRKPRYVGTTLYQDCNLAVGTYHSAPNHVVRIKINDEYGDYVTDIGSGSSKAMILIAETSTWATGAGGALTYAWSVTGWSGTAGSTTATFTGNAPAGAYWVYLTITWPNGGSMTVQRFVRIHSNADPAVKVLIDGVGDTRDRAGRQMTVRIKRSDASAIPPGAKCILWSSAPTWGGSDVASATKKFVGYLDSRSLKIDPSKYETEISVVSPMDVLSEMRSLAHAFEYDGTSADWAKLPAVLSTTQFVMWWVLRWRTNFLNSFDFTPLSVDNAIHRSKIFDLAPGKVGEQLKALADSIAANVGCRSNGEMIVKYDPLQLYDRSGLVTRGTMSAYYWSGVNIQNQEQAQTGFVKAEGSFSDLTTTTKCKGEAPDPTSGGRGGREVSLQKQLYESLTDAARRSGRVLAKANNPYPQITLDFARNIDVFEPVDMQRVIVDVPASKSPTGSAFTITAIPTVVRKNWIAGRRASVSMDLEAETNGQDGVAAIIVDRTQSVYPTPYPTPITFPPPTTTVDDIPPEAVITPGSNAMKPGEFVIRKTPTKVYRSFNGTVAAPTWDDVTPSGVTNVAMATMDLSTTFSRRCYVLTNDGTDSKVYVTEDIGATTPIWVAGATIAGVYTNIETARGSIGYVWVYNPNNSGTTTTDSINFVNTAGAVTIVGTDGMYSPGVGWVSTIRTFGGDAVVGTFSLDIPSRYISTINLTCVYAAEDVYANMFLYAYSGGTSGTVVASTTIDAAPGTHTFTLTVNAVIDNITWDMDTDSTLLTQVTTGLSYTYPSSTGDALTRYSVNKGASFYPEKEIGDSPGSAGGFSIGKNAPVVLAAADAQVKKAATLGGAFSNASGGNLASSDPLAILFLWYRLGSVSAANSGTSPDYIFASAALVGGEGLWKVDGVTGVATAITPSVSGNKLVAVSSHALSSWKGKHFVIAGATGGDEYAAKTENAGVSWVTSAIPNLKSMRCQRLHATGKNWIGACGTSGLAFSDDGGVTWLSVAAGNGVDDNEYAEIFG